MALGATAAKLLASLDLDTRPFEAGIARTNKSLGGLEGRFGKIGKVAAVGVGAAAGVGLLALGRGIKGGIDSLAQLESATSAVDGAIKQMGLTGQVTSAQVASWASEIEKNVGSAFDDKDITRAAATLIRFGKITPTNLRPALTVMTDLATKTGDVDSASKTLAKALADPAKAAGVLKKAGVVLTDQQQKQIKAMVKAGDAAGAQAFLLGELEKTTKGAAAASQGPFQRSQNELRDAIEDAERALGEGFLPVIEKVRDILKTELAKPGTIENLRNFGKGLAGGLDRLIDIAKGLPWDSIGNAFKLVGQGSKAALDLFTGLPPWVQTAVLTGWGLNKLTGGGLGTIVGELGKGLIKGVLGMNAGVVNINAAVVNGAGGVPGGAVGGAAAGGISTLGKVFLIGEAIGLVLAVNEVRDKIATGLTEQTSDIGSAVSQQVKGTDIDALRQSLAGVDAGIEKLSHDPIGNAILGDQLSELKKMRADIVARLNELNTRNKPGSPDDRDQRHKDALAIATKLDKLAERRHTKIEDTGSQAKPVKTDPKILQQNEARAAKLEAQRKLLASLDSRTQDVKAHTDLVKQSTDTVRDRLEAARIALASATQNSATRVSSSASNDADRIIRALYDTKTTVTVFNRSGSPDERDSLTQSGTTVRTGGGARRG